MAPDSGDYAKYGQFIPGASTKARRLRVSAFDQNVHRVGGRSLAAPDANRLKEQVEEILLHRELRERFFDPEFCSDSAWDILLALSLAELQFRRISVRLLCDATKLPSTTALRWVKHLADKGLVNRYPDQHDRRRVYLELTDDASDAMRSYFESLDEKNSVQG